MNHELNNPTKMMENLAEMMKSAMPQVKTNANGYEIRTKVLEMAQTNVWQDFHAKWAGYETSIVKDPKTGEIVTSVEMPTVPGTESVIETAQKFYDFVNNMSNKK